MKVLIVNRYMSIYGGAEQVVKELSSNLTKKGIENLVLTLNISEEVEKIAEDVSMIIPDHNFSYEFRSYSLISSVGILKEIYYLRNLVKKHYENFDVINVHNFPANWVVGGLNKPVVWMCNEMPDFYNNLHPSIFIKGLRAVGIKIDRYLVNKCVDIICVADRLNSQAVFSRYRRKSYIVPYGVVPPAAGAVSQEGGSEIRNRYRLEKEDFIMMQAGVVSPTKNQKDSIDTVIKLKGSISNIKLVLAGNDRSPYADYLKEYVRQNNVEDKVIFTGQLPKEEIYILYSICKLCLFPVKLQGGYLAVFEAIAAGVPVIVSPIMGAASLVREKNLGIVSEGFPFYVRKIYEHYRLFQDKVKEGSKWVRNRLTWERFSERFVEIFDEAHRGKRV